MSDPDPPFFVLDLDDTLYPERDYARSALSWAGAEMAAMFGIGDLGAELWTLFCEGAANPLAEVWQRHGLPPDRLPGLVNAMRAHPPAINLFPDAAALLRRVRAGGGGFAIVTDGRGVTQRAKLAALGIDDAALVSISEEAALAKTDPARFAPIAALVGSRRCICIGDNPAKDFVVANALGWESVMRAHDGLGIHAQALPEDPAFHPGRMVATLAEV